MTPQQLIQKATLLLDLRKDAQGAAAALEAAIATAHSSNDVVSEIEARCFLGELLLELGDTAKAASEFSTLLGLHTSPAQEALVSRHRETAIRALRR